MRINKKISGVILFCIILLIVLVLVSCQKEQNGENTKTNNENKTDESQKNNDNPVDNNSILFPEGDYDFEGYNFRVLINGPDHGDYESKEIYAEGDTGEVLNDAVRKRNIQIEDKYNFKISVNNNAKWGEIPTIAKKLILAGSDEYDMIMPMINDAAPLAHDKLIMNLNALPGLNLSAPWWDQRANDQLSIYNKLYFTTGDIGVLDKYCTFVTFFNKTLVADLGLENPYELVNSGNWTQDKVSEFIKGASKDLNGDAMMDYNDRWGLLTDTSIPMAMFFGSGEHITKKTPDGGLEITILNERSQNVLNNAFKFIYDKANVIFAEELKSSHATVWDAASAVFAENRALFRMCALIGVNEKITVSSEINFGILPQPKFNKEQAEYNNFVSTLGVPGVCVPITCGNPERTGVIIDAFARYADKTVRHAFYDIILNNRLIRDTESGEMLDIIFKTRTYDLGVIYNFGTLRDMFYNMASKRNENFVSECEKRMPKATKELSAILEKYASIEE